MNIPNLFDNNTPRIFRERVGTSTQLNSSKLIIYALGDRTSGLRGIVRIERNIDRLSVVQDSVDRSADSGRSRGEALQQAVLLRGFHHVVDGELALGDLELVPRASQLNDRLAGDSRKNQTVQRAGDELSLALLVDPEEEDVHRASLHDNSVGAHAQDLAVALLFPLVSGQNRRSVVGSQLVGSVTTRPGTHMVLICDQLDRLEAGGIVRTRRRANSVQHASLGWMNA